MSEPDPKDKHAQKWRIPLEEVAGQTSGHLVDPPSFTTVELLANIKRGSEVVLGGVASMPDVLQKIQELRLEQNEIILEERRIVESYEKLPNNGLSDEQRTFLVNEKREKLAPLHDRFKKTRMELARFMVGSLVNHVLLETAAVDGKRAEQVVEVNKAQVLQDRNDLMKMFPEKKRRSLTNPLGH